MKLSKIYNDHPDKFDARKIVEEYISMLDKCKEEHRLNVMNDKHCRVSLGGCLIELFIDNEGWAVIHKRRELYHYIEDGYRAPFFELKEHVRDLIYRLIYDCPPTWMNHIAYEHWELVRGYTCDYWCIPIYTDIDYENRWHSWFGEDNCPPDKFYIDKVRAHDMVIPMFTKT